MVTILRLTLLLCALACPWAAQAQLTPRTLQWHGVTRTWEEHRPAGDDGSKALPLVIALHGFSDTGAKFAALSEWETVSDAQGVLVAFPDGGLGVGMDYGWNNFVFDGSDPDDVGFLLALIQQLQVDHRVDADRIFMTGFSNGAGMTNNFAGIHPEVLAGIAPISGGWLTAFGVPESAMERARPLPIWVWGNDGDDFQNGSELMSVEEQQQLQFWMRLNGNLTTPRVSTAAPYETRVYPGGRAEARYTRCIGGEHAYHSGVSAKVWSDFFSHLSRQNPYTPPVTFGDWENRYFSADEMNNAAISGDLADPDGDGTNNLLEYALDRHPRKGDAGAAITATEGGQALTLRFRLQPAAADLQYTAEIRNLATGEWIAGGVRLPDEIDPVNGGAVGAFSDTAAGNGRWMRLRVTRH